MSSPLDHRRPKDAWTVLTTGGLQVGRQMAVDQERYLGRIDNENITRAGRRKSRSNWVDEESSCQQKAPSSDRVRKQAWSCSRKLRPVARKSRDNQWEIDCMGG